MAVMELERPSDYLAAFGRRKWLVLLVTLSLASLALLVATFWPPIYRSSATILIEEPEAFTPPGLTIRAATADVWLDGGETIDAAGITFAVTAVPGHSPAHLAYFADGELFSGDVLFAGSVGRTDFPS